jgi:ABC-type glutathione transport system ATPase component
MTTLRDVDGAAQGKGPILEARGLTRTYARGGSRGALVPALSGVDLPIMPGDTLGIVGESGSGKSTLARLLLALDRPTTGDVLFRGRSVVGRRERDLREFRQRVQIVFQDPMGSLDPRMRVRDIVAEPLRALKVARLDEEHRVGEVLDAVGLPDSSRARYPAEFSGGQRQRIAIARALAPKPEVLIADEPVSALDVSVRAQILNLLAALVMRERLTLVFISHDMAVVRHLCDRVAVMYRGAIVESGAADRIYEAPSHDYTRSLLASVLPLRWAT